MREAKVDKPARPEKKAANLRRRLVKTKDSDESNDIEWLANDHNQMVMVFKDDTSVVALKDIYQAVFVFDSVGAFGRYVY